MTIQWKNVYTGKETGDLTWHKNEKSIKKVGLPLTTKLAPYFNEMELFIVIPKDCRHTINNTIKFRGRQACVIFYYGERKEKDKNAMKCKSDKKVPKY